MQIAKMNLRLRMRTSLRHLLKNWQNNNDLLQELFIWGAVVCSALFVQRYHCSHTCAMTGVFELVSILTKSKDIMKITYPKVVRYVVLALWNIGFVFIVVCNLGKYYHWFAVSPVYTKPLVVSYYTLFLISGILSFTTGKSKTEHYVCPIAPCMAIGTKVGRSSGEYVANRYKKGELLMKQDEIYKLEVGMWEAAKARSAKAFLELVSEDAVMVCGGYRCSGREYAEIISMFDCKEYKIENFEVVNVSEDSIQVHYVISVEVEQEENRDLAGLFHVTTTWKCTDNVWKAVFNMDQRIMLPEQA